MKSYLVKVLETQKNVNGETTIIVLNERLYELLTQPMVITGGGESTIIPKDCILCDGCNEPDPEYVMTDGDYLERAVCEKCRQKYFSKLEIKKEV